MTASLHLGPYDGRDPELADVVERRAVQPDDPGARVEGRARDRGRVPPRSRRVRPGRARGPTPSARSAATRGRRSACSPTRAPTARSRRPSELELARLVASARRRARRPGLDRSRRRGSRRGAARRPRAPGRLRRCRRARDGGRAVGRRRRDVEAEAGLAALRLVQQIRPVVSRDRTTERATPSRPTPSRDATRLRAHVHLGRGACGTTTWCSVPASPSTPRSCSSPTGCPGLDVDARGPRGRQRDRRTVPPRARRPTPTGHATPDAPIRGVRRRCEPRAVSPIGRVRRLRGRAILVHAGRVRTRHPTGRRCRSAIAGSTVSGRVATRPPKPSSSSAS